MSVVAEPVTARRLTLVPLRAEHADEMFAVLADPGLYRFIGGAPPTLKVLRARYERLAAGSPDPAISWCNWVIQLHSDHRLAGTVQATVRTEDDEPVAEIAWVVGRPWQGQGIATEAAQAFVAWLQRQSIHTVIAHIDPGHKASAAVAAAAGLTPTDDWQEGEIRWRLSMTR
jgi:RimJ/RimL family protein N-acetyltransferase